MSSSFRIDDAVLLGSVLLAVGMAVSGLATRFRVPVLLVFLVLGMIVADDGLALVRFSDTELAQNVAVVALAIILFEGGLATRANALRRSGPPAAVLATVGVAITAGIVSIGAWLVFDLPMVSLLLIGAVVASTDAAAVFGALRGEPLPERVRDLLQVESGANDPLAVMLTIGLVEAWRADPGATEWLTFGARQLMGGVTVGCAVGFAATAVVRRLRLPSGSSYAVLALAVAGLSYGAAAAAGSSGFLAVYLTGVLLNRSHRLARSMRTFYEGLAAAAQAILFLMLGLLVFPSDLASEIGGALVIAAFLVLVARPVAVLVCLAPFRFPRKDLTIVSWAGLRGAVPIVLATIPLTAGHPHGQLVFDVVFVVVVISVAIQAPTISVLARRLGYSSTGRGAVVEVSALDSLTADIVEVKLAEGSPLIDQPLRLHPVPRGARVAMVVRGDTSFVADGDTTFLPDDVLLVAVTPGEPVDDLIAWAT